MRIYTNCPKRAVDIGYCTVYYESRDHKPPIRDGMDVVYSIQIYMVVIFLMGWLNYNNCGINFICPRSSSCSWSFLFESYNL